MARGVRKRAERIPSNLNRLKTVVGKPLASPAASSAPISSPSLEDADMSAIPDDFIRKTARLSAEVTRPYPNSKKIYVQGSRSDVRVGMREVEQAATHGMQGDELNPPIPLYVSSGLYTDPKASIVLLLGLVVLRLSWFVV